MRRPVVYYPYSTSEDLSRFGGLGEDMSIADFVATLKELAQGETLLGENYSVLQQMAQMGGAPALFVQGYNNLAAQWNQLAANLQALNAILDGPTRAQPEIARYIEIQLDRAVTPESILYPDELFFGALNKPTAPQGLGQWWSLIPWGRAIVVAGLTYAYHRYTAKQMSDNAVKIAQIKADAAAFQGSLNQQTYLVNQAYNAVRGCMGSKYGSSDPALYQKCLATATQNIVKIGKDGIPKPPEHGSGSGLGILAWVGIIALAATGGAFLWSRHRRRQEL